MSMARIPTECILICPAHAATLAMSCWRSIGECAVPFSSSRSLQTISATRRAPMRWAPPRGFVHNLDTRSGGGRRRTAANFLLMLSWESGSATRIFCRLYPTVPANPAQSMPLWDYSDEAIAAFKRLNPDDTFPRHWTYQAAFGERAYADWMWSYHRACANLMRTAKDTLCQAGLNSLKIYRNLTRCSTFYVGNDHGGMGLDMCAREMDIVSADPYPASDRGYNDSSIPRDMGYVAGLARRHKKELMPWMQGHEIQHPSVAHLNRLYEQHVAQEPTRIMYLGYGNHERPPRGTAATFPGGNPDSWEESRQLNVQFRQRVRGNVKARAAVVRDYHVWSLNSFGDVDCLDRLFTDILGEISDPHGTPFDPIEVRSLDALDWAELEAYSLVVVALARKVPKHCWRRFAELPGKCVFLASDCETLVEDEGTTGVRSSGEIVYGGDVTTFDGVALPSLYTRRVEVSPNVHTLGTYAGETCIWRIGSIVYVSARIRHEAVPAFAEWLGACECPELIDG